MSKAHFLAFFAVVAITFQGQAQNGLPSSDRSNTFPDIALPAIRNAFIYCNSEGNAEKPLHYAAAKPGAEDAQQSKPALAAYLDLALGGLFGLQYFARGGSAAIGTGLLYSPWECGLRSAFMWDQFYLTPRITLDSMIGIAPGVRIVVGGNFMLGQAQMEKSGVRYPVTTPLWPSRYGLSVSVGSLGKIWGAWVALDAEIVYMSLNMDKEDIESITGTYAFGAAIEASLFLKLRWSGSR